MSDKPRSADVQETLLRISDEWKAQNYGLDPYMDEKTAEHWSMHISWLIGEIWKMRAERVPHLHLDDYLDGDE